MKKIIPECKIFMCLFLLFLTSYGFWFNSLEVKLTFSSSREQNISKVSKALATEGKQEASISSTVQFIVLQSLLVQYMENQKQGKIWLKP